MNKSALRKSRAGTNTALALIPLKRANFLHEGRTQVESRLGQIGIRLSDRIANCLEVGDECNKQI